MKKIFGLAVLLMGMSSVAMAFPYGRVKVVNAFADFTVRFVE